MTSVTPMITTTSGSNNQTGQISTFTEAVGTFLSASILPSLASWLEQNKGVKVTVDEMVTALSVPQSKSNGMPTTKIPAFLQGTGTTLAPDPNPKTKVTRGRKKTNDEVKGPPCTYVFKRNARRDKMCGNPTVPYPDGLIYCNPCRKKAAVKQEIARVTGGDHSPPPQNGPTITLQDNDSDVEEGETIWVDDYPGKPGYYIEPNNGFIFQRLPDGRALVRKVLDKNDKRERDPNEEDIKTATKLGFYVMTES